MTMRASAWTCQSRRVSRPALKRPAEVVALLGRRFATAHRSWLGSPVGHHDWPVDVPLGVPTEAQALREAEAVRLWAGEWRAWPGPGQVQWVDRQWRSLGA